jgi:uncharacterized protein
LGHPHGRAIATEKLNFNQPGEFFDVEYDVPLESPPGQTRITVKFQAQPGKNAGGLYDLRVVTKDGKTTSTSP